MGELKHFIFRPFSLPSHHENGHISAAINNHMLGMKVSDRAC